MSKDMGIAELTEKLLKNLREEIDLYHIITDFTRQQRKTIDSNDIKGLLEFVRQKESVIGEIRTIDDALTPYRDEWKARKNEMGDSAREECEKFVGELNTILTDLIKLEGENEALLAVRVKKVEQNLQKVQQGKKAQESYQNTAVPAQFIDRKN